MEPLLHFLGIPIRVAVFLPLAFLELLFRCLAFLVEHVARWLEFIGDGLQKIRVAVGWLMISSPGLRDVQKLVRDMDQQKRQRIMDRLRGQGEVW